MTMKVGDKVSLCRYDYREPPWNKHGNGVVTKIDTTQNCESGVMVTVDCQHHGPITVDQGWLVKIIKTSKRTA